MGKFNELGKQKKGENGKGLTTNFIGSGMGVFISNQLLKLITKGKGVIIVDPKSKKMCH